MPGSASAPVMDLRRAGGGLVTVAQVRRTKTAHIQMHYVLSGWHCGTGTAPSC